jgi:hypothetical protein
MKYAMLAVLALTGCATSAKRLNHVEPGMTQAQVEKELGEAESSKAINNERVLVYYLHTAQDCLLCKTEHWVVLRQGKVVYFGKAGDYSSAVPDTHKLIIEREPSSR